MRANPIKGINGSKTLGVGFLDGLRRSIGITGEIPVTKSLSSDMTDLDHARLTMILRHAEELYVTPIGKGVHRPYKVRLKTAESCGIIDCSEVVFKTVGCQYETKRYCSSVDLTITGPEREVLAYELDRVMKFNLVPPTVGRHIDGLGYGSVMAWVKAPMAVELTKSKEYKYKEHPENIWLHRLAAFDFITGQIDRHAANFMLDKDYRVYAIDNGYSFVKNDDRTFLKCNPGKYLVGKPVPPSVTEHVRGIDKEKVWKTLQHRGFKQQEAEGVMKRIDEMSVLPVWRIMGGMWDPAK
jgi:hypothetical protein